MRLIKTAAFLLGWRESRRIVTSSIKSNLRASYEQGRAFGQWIEKRLGFLRFTDIEHEEARRKFQARQINNDQYNQVWKEWSKRKDW